MLFGCLRLGASIARGSPPRETVQMPEPTISRRKAYKRVSSDCEAVAIENTTKEISLVVLVIFSLKMQSRLVGFSPILSKLKGIFACGKLHYYAAIFNYTIFYIE